MRLRDHRCSALNVQRSTLIGLFISPENYAFLPSSLHTAPDSGIRMTQDIIVQQQS
jgi:hypothetical protein